MRYRQILGAVLCVAVLLLLWGCTGPEKPVIQTGPQALDYQTVRVGVDPLPCTEEALFDALFDPDNKISVQLDMEEGELAKLQADYDRYRAMGSKSPIYRMATVTVTITTEEGSIAYRIEEVGLRMKGNTSRTDFYSDRDGIHHYIHFKLDFQETFDDPEYYGSNIKEWQTEAQREERKNRTFATLEKLELRWNKCYDSTYLKELYAYELYRSEGVMAPMANLSSLSWSGLHMGIYTLLEPVDQVFLEKRLPQEELGGDLYKCGWSSEGAGFTSLTSIGVEDEDRGLFYAYDLKTNKKTSSHQALKDMIRRLNAGDLTGEDIAEVVDTENFLRFAAVSWFLGNPDDLRNNRNNYYLYFRKSDGKALFIPYDYDRCLGVTYEWDPTGDGVTTDDPFGDTMAADSSARQQNPLYLYSIVRGGFYVEEYADALKRVAENPLLDSDTFKTYFERARSLYGQEVQPSKTLRNAEGRTFAFANQDGIGGNLSFHTYITKKLATYGQYTQNPDSYLNRQPPERTDYYIRADFTNWDMQEAYGASPENGLVTWMLELGQEARFKVYNDRNGGWYGVESLPQDCPVSYTTDHHGNIVLQPGTYTVTYDPLSNQVTLTKK